MNKQERMHFFRDPREVQRDACGVGFVANMKGIPSHKIVKDGLTILNRLDHRGGRASDNLTGDGAGIMVGIPHSFISKLALEQSWSALEPGKYAVGVLFSPKDQELDEWTTNLVESVVREEGQELVGWRDVPVNSAVLGPIAKESEPRIRHFFIRKGVCEAKSFPWKLYVMRKVIEERARSKLGITQKDVYICSLSTSTMIYKGLLLSHLISEYYLDLKNEDFKTPFSLVHQRFSTNTMPSWPLAQPFRFIGHNGEINTLRGNINWMRARQSQLKCEIKGADLEKIGSVCTPGASDSAILDNTIEFLLHSGRSMEKVLSMVVPEPWENRMDMPQELKDYYEYQSCLMEPWDGPAFIGFADGHRVGAVLDRNGLRPGRYWITRDDHVIMGSEAGLLDVAPEEIVSKGRLSPGKMFMVDMENGEVKSNEALKSSLASDNPYGHWLSNHRVKLSELPIPVEEPELLPNDEEMHRKQHLFSYTREDLRVILAPMAMEGKEPTGSMGNDAPLAILSRKRPLLFNYFKQLFAQVTNPAIDAIREELVTSLATSLGPEGNLLDESHLQCKMIRMKQPILSNLDLKRIKVLRAGPLKTTTLSICYDPLQANLRQALQVLRREVERAIEEGHTIVILSDREATLTQVAIPSLLAVSAVHHELINQGLRTRCSLILESAEPREVHHFCTLLGYGVAAINPYLALDIIRKRNPIDGYGADLNVATLQSNYIRAIGKGILKVMSKIGISTLQSYRGAQIFEAVGLSQQLVDDYFTWTPTRIEGLVLEDIERDLLSRYREVRALAGKKPHLDVGGDYHWRRNGEKHLHSPDMIASLQHATQINGREEFAKFCETVDDQSKVQLTLRGLMRYKPASKPIALEEVESVPDILRRFSTGAMSFGSISKEAHETIAVAMNRMGGRSNSGEGGEDAERFTPDPNGDLRRSAIKQVASGRFGVTSHYLVNADELQIKIAQGAKPGEGGQLPGHKVDQSIAKVRHSTPGVTLISPPPHHDIYSIEDLAQLIHDLKNANDQARVSVKLVSAVGVGTIAAGVAKAKSDVILISGYEGGTGASPITSIKHTGLPWELGLADTHRTLLENGLRDRIVLQTDGQLRTPRDLAIATMLGAEEWSIGSGALVALGCIMMRKCHLNTCPVGIATQDPELRKKFHGKPEHLINYFVLLAEGLREIMASLGIRKVTDLVGRSDLLSLNDEIEHPLLSRISLDQILGAPEKPVGKPYQATLQDHELEQSLDRKILLPALKRAIESKEPAKLHVPIRNTNRTVGTIVSSEISRRHGAKGLPRHLIRLHFKGSAGQSFMAFGAKGVFAKVEGEVNDYCGKGLSGADIVVVPPSQSSPEIESQIICGNTTLYGATSGRMNVLGRAGERFAVRNSGAIAVVEGAGDHCCEYMTGGRVVVLGSTGRNFGAGMSGGIAYVYDQTGEFSARVNPEMVSLEQVSSKEDRTELYHLIKSHLDATGSRKARRILDDWDNELSKFVRVIPGATGGKTSFLPETVELDISASGYDDHLGTNKLEQGGFHG
ncbi:glutamate synthase large subunit [Pseudobacteriovorax antillogorgiicola]|uniref:Glutamate synthase [NADPH] large chain n=1 Tax=Pseudobacteriovorax antillogorgiicola TaxID=1513793 RepID=A0A1Y6C270_9BACT|nr:glutamate synthase large subunit [Pseudobacteriovorax antillogorgiicola]TCS50237.1 glutamate synthase (NADH) large subunit [Pseudobacteriovorax antillogorgiicola]SMF32765.1 glutamate synthase (ferredoxin) [Pseudobacteriovorax antillogorgiicola]